MERRRRYNRHFLQTMHTLLPPVLLVTQLSLVLTLCSFFILVDYAECIMTFREESGVYSLFPDEDLKTGRKRLRFDEEAATTTRNYRDGRDYLVRSYPMLPHDRLHRPVDFSGGGGGGREGGSRQVYDDYNRDRDRERHGRVYFDDSFRSSRFDFHRLTPRPRPIERPVNPIIFETSRRPYHHHFLPDSFPPGPPAIGQSKLPPGASSRASGEDVPTRIHVFNPESNSFGNPRNAGGGGGDGNDGTSSSERAKGPPSNFVETGPPGPESFLNHEEFLEYQKKIAFARFHEQDGPSGNGGGGGSSSSSGGGGAGKKVLFESKEPFEIDGLVPPDKSGENSGKLPTTSKVPLQHTHGQLSSSASPPSPPRTQQQRHQNHQILLQHQQEDQRQHQRSQQQQPHHHHQQHSSQQQREGQKVRPSPTDATNNNGHRPQQQQPPPQHRHHNVNDDAEEERDNGGGEVESDIVNEKGDEVESENGKSEVTQLPPTHITKSGRDRDHQHHHHRNHHQQHQHSSDGGGGHSGSVSDHSGGGGGAGSSRSASNNNKKFTPSISHNEGGGGTGFKLPTTAISYSDEPPNLNGFVPVVPFHLIGAEQPRAISLERPRQQQQQRIVPHHHHHHTLHEAPVRSTAATTTTSSTTIRSIPVTTTIASASTTTARSKGEKLGFRPTTEAAKGFTPSSPFSSFIPTGNIDDGNNSNNNGGGGTSGGIINSSSGFPSSPASPILHATAGERSNSETHSKVAITKQQELKRLQKQRQLTSSMHHPITPPHSAGLFPDFGLGDSSASSDSADNSNDNPGTFTNTLNANGFLDEMMVTPHSSPPRNVLSLSSPTTTSSSSTPTQQHQQNLLDTNIHNSTPSPSSSETLHDPSSEQNTQHLTQDINTPAEKQSQFNLHTSSLIDYSNPPPVHNAKNYTHDETMMKHEASPPPLDEQKINTLVELNNSEQEHGSVTLGDDETIKSVVAPLENNHNGLLDTRAVKIANGIKQGEFLLEGYMINSNNNNEDGDGAAPPPPGVGRSSGGSSLSSRSNAEDADYTNNNINNHMNEENVGSQHHHHHRLYDYPDPNDDNLPIIVDEGIVVGTSSAPIIPPDENDDDEDDAANHSHHDNIPLSPVIPQLPGTTTPDLEQNLTPSSLTTTTKNSTSYLFDSPKNPTFSTGSGGSSSSSSSSGDNNNSGGVTDDNGSRTTSRQRNSVDGGEDVTENEDFSKSSEPILIGHDVDDTHSRNSPSSAAVVNAAVNFEAEPTPPPELRRTRLSEINQEKNSFVAADDQDAPTNPFYNSNHNLVNSNKDINIAFFPYYDSYGNKINASEQGSSGGSSSSSSGTRNRDDDEIFSYSGSGEGAYQYQDENGAFENDQFNGLDKATFHRESSLAGSSSSSSHANANNFRSKHTRKSNSKIVKLRIMDASGNFIEDDDGPSSISIPVEASLNYNNGVISNINGRPNFSSSSGSVGGTITSSNSVSDFNSIDNINDGADSESDGFVGIRKGVGGSVAAAVEDYGPLYLESSETLINKTYYLDGNYNSIHTTSSTNNGKNNNSNSIKSSNFIKVTRIKTSSGPSSQETAEKTASTILARRTSKPAVIVSTSAAGARPKVVGSVVEAGPAWPGLVSNFLRTNGHYNTNRSFTATATVRPRGNSGTNPSPPTAVISGQIEQISREQAQQQIHHTKHHHRQQSPHTPPPPPQQLQQGPPPTASIKPTEFQLQQIRTPAAGISSATTTAASIIVHDPSANNNHVSRNRNFANHHHQHRHQNTNNANDNHHHNTNSSSITSKKSNSVAPTSANNNLAKQVNANSSNQQQQPHNNNDNYNSSSFNIRNSNNNSTDSNSTKTHTIARRLYTSSEEIRSNSSTGIVSLVHAHISHCPKLHSPTEVICDVHIREGHGIANPQLTVGWRRKFYNSTQPDVLLALNKAPASGENGHFEPHHSILEVQPGKDERLEEFHDKFNVTLAPGISPMLRSVLLIRSVAAPDTGTYQCEVNDGINVLKSETLLFLCHK